MRIFSTKPITSFLNEVTNLRSAIENSIEEVLGSSQKAAQRKITRELEDKAKETSLVVKQVACKYWPAENFLTCKLTSIDGVTSIFGQFELSQYKEEEPRSPLISELVENILNNMVRDPLISLLRRLP